MRASGSDDAVRLVPYKQLTLEQCIEFIADDELVEVTPKSLRLRKKVLQANRRPRKGSGTNKPRLRVGVPPRCPAINSFISMICGWSMLAKMS